MLADPVYLLLFIIVAVVIIAAILSVVKAAFALPPLSELGLAPYLNVVYALIVLLLVLLAVSYFYPGHVFSRH